jgi:hypothetical protein
MSSQLLAIHISARVSAHLIPSQVHKRTLSAKPLASIPNAVFSRTTDTGARLSSTKPGSNISNYESPQRRLNSKAKGVISLVRREAGAAAGRVASNIPNLPSVPGLCPESSARSPTQRGSTSLSQRTPDGGIVLGGGSVSRQTTEPFEADTMNATAEDPEFDPHMEPGAGEEHSWHGIVPPSLRSRSTPSTSSLGVGEPERTNSREPVRTSPPKSSPTEGPSSGDRDARRKSASQQLTQWVGSHSWRLELNRRSHTSKLVVGDSSPHARNDDGALPPGDGDVRRPRPRARSSPNDPRLEQAFGK